MRNQPGLCQRSVRVQPRCVRRGTGWSACTLALIPLLTRLCPACNAGFGNCDGNTANGCENPLSSNPNCGLCGFTCPSGFGYSCTNKACTKDISCGDFVTFTGGASNLTHTVNNVGGVNLTLTINSFSAVSTARHLSQSWSCKCYGLTAPALALRSPMSTFCIVATPAPKFSEC